QPKNNAAVEVQPTILGSPVETTVGSLNHPAVGSTAIDLAGEVVKIRVTAIDPDTKYGTASLSTVRHPAADGCPIKVPVAALNQRSVRIRPIGRRTNKGIKARE